MAKRWVEHIYPPTQKKEEQNITSSLRTAIIWLLLIYIAGAYAFEQVEGWNLVDSVYFITSTISTVGYGDITPQTDVGKLMAVFLIWTGISLAFYIIYTFAAYREQVIDQEIKSRIGRRLQMFRDLINLRGRRE